MATLAYCSRPNDSAWQYFPGFRVWADRHENPEKMPDEPLALMQRSRISRAGKVLAQRSKALQAQRTPRGLRPESEPIAKRSLECGSPLPLWICSSARSHRYLTIPRLTESINPWFPCALFALHHRGGKCQTSGQCDAAPGYDLLDAHNRRPEVAATRGARVEAVRLVMGHCPWNTQMVQLEEC